jgi:hypothetical protein
MGKFLTVVFKAEWALWHYSNRSKVEAEVGLLLLFHIDVERNVEQQLSIEIKDGVVRDYWIEERRA